MHSTIFAPSTIIGKSAVAIIRISGAHALSAVNLFCRNFQPKARYAHHVTLKIHNIIIDNALLIYFPSPHSFTGEDIIELHTHGSIAVVNSILEELAKLPNFRYAKPGEFTQRALLNKKISLLEAEGLLNVIHAQTQEQLNFANKEFHGENAKIFHELRSRILNLFANIEALIDFPEDDLGDNTTILAGIIEKLTNLKNEIDIYLNDNQICEKIHDGFKITIIGKPNVGKSTLLNFIAKAPLAITSEIAGTTRDLISVDINIAGFSVKLIDTAGIRQSEDSIEIIGIERAKDAFVNADIAIILCEKQQDYEELSKINWQYQKHIKVLTKMDDNDCSAMVDGFILISIHKKLGTELLFNAIKEKIQELFPVFSPIIFNKRQRSLFTRISENINNISLRKDIEFLDIIAEEMRIIKKYAEELIGIITDDEVLDELFNGFCIGK